MKSNVQDDFIDIKEIIKKFISKWHYFAVSLILCGLVAFIVVKKSTKIYEITSTMRLETGTTKSELILDEGRNSVDKNKNIDDEILVIKSTDYVSEALNKLDYNIAYFTKNLLKKSEQYKTNFPFGVTIDSSFVQITGVPIVVNILSDSTYEINIEGKDVALYDFNSGIYLKQQIPKIDFHRKYKFGKLAKEDFFGFTINLINDPRMFDGEELSFEINSREQLTKKYLRKLDITAADRNSNILQLTIEGSDVQRNIEFLNSLMEVVREKDLDEKNQEGIATINFIDYQLEDVSQSLNKAEQDLESYQYSTTKLGETSALYSKRDQLESELADLNLRMNYFRNILSNLESVEGVSRVSGPSSVGIDDPILSSLLQKLTDLNQQRIQLGRTATEANPVVQRLDLEIKTTKEALRDKINGAINTTNIMVNDITSRISQTNSMINRLPSAEIRRLGVERKLNFSDNTYDLFQERRAAAAIALATNVSDWKIVEWAKMNGTGPVSPNKMFIFLLAFFIGIVVPAGGILMVDFLNNSVKSKNDLEKITNIPILGTVTKGNRYVKLASEYDSRSPLLESLRSVRLNLQFFLSSRSNQVIGMTSSTSGEGKTFCAVNLGVVLAQSGKKVLVLDADMRKSNMSSYFSLDNNIGLSTFLIGNSNLERVINHSKVNNLDVIMSGPFPPNPFELLSLPKTNELITHLRTQYDYIIIDTPPLGIVSDYLLFLQHVDASVYVVRHNHTKKGYLEKINDLYENKKTQNLGIVLNDVKASALYGGIYGTAKGSGYYSKRDISRKTKVSRKHHQIESSKESFAKS